MSGFGAPRPDPSLGDKIRQALEGRLPSSSPTLADAFKAYVWSKGFVIPYRPVSSRAPR